VFNWTTSAETIRGESEKLAPSKLSNAVRRRSRFRWRRQIISRRPCAIRCCRRTVWSTRRDRGGQRIMAGPGGPGRGRAGTRSGQERRRRPRRDGRGRSGEGPRGRFAISAGGGSRSEGRLDLAGKDREHASKAPFSARKWGFASARHPIGISGIRQMRRTWAATVQGDATRRGVAYAAGIWTDQRIVGHSQARQTTRRSARPAEQRSTTGHATSTATTSTAGTGCGPGMPGRVPPAGKARGRAPAARPLPPVARGRGR